VRVLCRVLGVSRSGFYAWRSRLPSARVQGDRRLEAAILECHLRSRGTYGAPRIWAELRELEIRTSRKRIARLMREAGIRGLHRPRRRRARPDPEAWAIPDLVGRRFRPIEPNRVWAADITEIRTLQGTAYLAVVMDLCSRRVVGWAFDRHMRTELVIDAFEMATGRRQPASGLVHHSDRGPQYTSLIFGEALERAGIIRSMGRAGTPADNAVVESFFDTLKLELFLDERLPTFEGARAKLFEWIEVFYNRKRRHTTLGGVSPLEFERRLALNR
jgi:putative transposase